MQTYLKPTTLLMPAVISNQPIKMETLNCTKSFDKSKTIKIPPKNICIVSNIVMPRDRPVILIRSPNPDKHFAEFSNKLIQQNSNQLPVNNSMEITAENIQMKIDREHLQTPLMISDQGVQPDKQIKAQSPQKSMLTSATKIIQESQESNVQNSAQTFVQHVKQNAQSLSKPSQSSMQTSLENVRKQSVGQNSQIEPMLNSTLTSVQHLEQTKAQTLHSSQENSVQISAHDITQTDVSKKTFIHSVTQNTVHSPNKILEEISMQKQTASQNYVDINDQYPKRVPTRIDHGKSNKQQDRETNRELLPISPPKLRKIMPKPQLFDPDTVPTLKVLKKWPPILNAMTKPDIVIIPKIENAPPNGFCKVSPYLGNTKPLLRISIQKESYSKQKPCSSNEVDENKSNNDTMIQREITIKNPTINRAVTFKLDPKTGEIVLITRQLDFSEIDKAASKSTTVKHIIDNVFTPTSVRHLYVKGRHEFTVLRKQLQLLRQSYKQEQDEIVTLQNHLSELGCTVPTICSKDSPKPKCAKRKDIINSIQPDDYGNLMREVKKTKHDIQRRKHDLATTENSLSAKQKNEFNATGKTALFRFSNVEIVSEIDDIHDDVFSEIEGVSTDFSEDSTSDDTA